MPVASKSLLEARVAFSGINQAFADPSSLPILATAEVPTGASTIIKGGRPADLLVALSAVSVLGLLRHTPENVEPFMDCVLVIGDALVNGVGGSDFRVRDRVIKQEGDEEMLLEQVGNSCISFAAVNLGIPELVESLPGPVEREVRFVLARTRLGKRLWVRPEAGESPVNSVLVVGAFCAMAEQLTRQSDQIQPLRAGAAGLCLLHARWQEMGTPLQISSQDMRRLFSNVTEVVRSPDPVRASHTMNGNFG